MAFFSHKMTKLITALLSLALSYVFVVSAYLKSKVPETVLRDTEFLPALPLPRRLLRLYVGTIDKRNLLGDKHEDDFKGKKSSGKQFDWEKQWYPLAVEEFTDKKKSHAMMFLGNNVILWHNGEKWSVFEDACPHRGVPLTEGRVEGNGELLCSYHAWTFNGEGECTSIPQTLTKEKEKTLLSKACVKSYPVQVRQGLVWVCGHRSFSEVSSYS